MFRWLVLKPQKLYIVFMDAKTPNSIELIVTKLKARNRSKQTIDRFKIYAKKFLTYLESKNKTLKEATSDDLTDYFALKEYCGNTKFTMFYAYKTIFSIWKIPWKLTRADVPKKSSADRPWFTNEEIQKIITTADKMTYQQAALVRVGRDCGCRRIQIQKMNRNNFKNSEEKPTLLVPDAKGGKPVEMRIGSDTAKRIQIMLEKRTDEDEALFVNERGERSSLAKLSTLFFEVRIFAKVDKKRAGIHAMRRSKVTRLVNAGMSEFNIVETMGWTAGSPMVHTYAQLDHTELQNKAAAADPLIDEDD